MRVTVAFSFDDGMREEIEAFNNHHEMRPQVPGQKATHYMCEVFVRRAVSADLALAREIVRDRLRFEAEQVE